MAGGEVSPEEVTRATLDHAQALNPRLNAYISFRPEEALAEARQAEEELRAGRSRGPLHGVPVALKDSVFMEGEVTTLGSKIHADFTPGHNAAVVDRLREAGAVIVGKLNLHEYAWGLTNDNPYYGVTRNPWNPDRLAGGSSGGSGVAAAANMSFLTIGADAAGSIRVPSAVCGGVGMKATYGRVSTYGDFPLAWTIGHVGPMVKDVTDAAATLQAIAGFDPRDPASVNVPVPDFSALLDESMGGRDFMEGVVVKVIVVGIEKDGLPERGGRGFDAAVGALVVGDDHFARRGDQAGVHPRPGARPVGLLDDDPRRGQHHPPRQPGQPAG